MLSLKRDKKEEEEGGYSLEIRHSYVNVNVICQNQIKWKERGEMRCLRDEMRKRKIGIKIKSNQDQEINQARSQDVTDQPIPISLIKI